MRAGRYEVLVRDRASGQRKVRRWTAAEIQTGLAWLKRANAQGREILIRPASGEDAALVLVSGLNAARVERMQKGGREPAVVVETSPGQLQAWVRVPACDEARRLEILKQLATERGTDSGLTRTGRYGRLAGFTNPGKGDGQREPWVLCRSSPGREASAGATLVAAAGERLEARAQAVREERERERELSRGRGGMSR